jgi:hypothetical protein
LNQHTRGHCTNMFVGSTPQKRPLHGNKVLGGSTPRIEKKYSGGNDRDV